MSPAEPSQPNSSPSGPISNPDPRRRRQAPTFHFSLIPFHWRRSRPPISADAVGHHRRTFLKRLFWLAPPLLIGGGTSAYGYGSLLERHQVTVEKYSLTLDLGPNAPAKLRIVGLTDLHFDPLFEEDYLAHCVNEANRLNPDLIVLTGDFITKSSSRIDDLSAILAKLNAKSGVYACLGNHDHWHQPSRVRTSLEKHGIPVLSNSHTRVPIATDEIVLAGLESVWGGQPSWTRAARGLTRHDRVLMLMHEPDHALQLRQDPRIVLQCSGHTHGGQVRLPGYGALVLPSHGKHFQSGLYTTGTLKLHVNRGLGTISKHVRFLCPPEIACLDITHRPTSA